MSGRSGVGQTRAATLGPQPLRATVPYQLHSKARPCSRDGKPAGKARSQQLSVGMRRTVSLDAIVGPYLQGHWPKEPEAQASLSLKDKSTQTPDSWWSDKSQSRGDGIGHKRSASWGSAEHLREIAKLKQQLQQRNRPSVSGGLARDSQHSLSQGTYSLEAKQTRPEPVPLAPLHRLTPRLHHSEEGLNQELEGMFICQPPYHQRGIPEVPDGRRAPVPPQSSSSSSSSGSQSDPPSTPLSQLCSASSSPSSSLCSSPSCLSISSPAAVDPNQGETSAEVCLLSPFPSHGEAEVTSPLLLSTSPRPNKSYCFQREPPEGCEKIRAWEETSAPRVPQPALISSCPDLNKVNFTPHGGSAFCPVSLLRPLLPSMDLLFHSLAVSPANGCSSTGNTPYQSPSPGSPF